MPLSRRFSLNRERMLAFLDGLEAPDGPSISSSLYLPPGLTPQDIAECLLAAGCRGDNEISELICGSKTGAVIFRGASHTYLVVPPFPIVLNAAKNLVVPGIVTAPLRELLTRDFNVALVLVRLGAYAIGLCRGQELTASKVGAGNIHGRHRQGGSSAGRFARHREKQIETFLTRVCGHIPEILGPDPRPVHYIVYGGSDTAIRLLRKRCGYLGNLDGRELPTLLDIHEPGRQVLEATVSRVWSSTVVEWRRDAVEQA